MVIGRKELGIIIFSILGLAAVLECDGMRGSMRYCDPDHGYFPANRKSINSHGSHEKSNEEK